jgi:hypothetical protein
MSDIFISYARSTEVRAQQIAEVLRGLVRSRRLSLRGCLACFAATKTGR